jgi:hypothetical protein
MYGLSDLKQRVEVADKTVECPHKECRTKVRRARRGDRLRQTAFLCGRHQIYVSPSTFEYKDVSDNLLWHDQSDLELLACIKNVKRESRLARENSEDALTWNTFRYLEKTHQLSKFLSMFLGSEITNARPSYWSYSVSATGVCPSLQRTRTEFGERLKRSSEPDLVIESDKDLIWIEAKLGSGNNTTPSNPKRREGYLTGGKKWFKRAFVSDYRSVAIKARRYELMRLWLLGSWAAADQNHRFWLVNLVPERAAESGFQKHIAKLPNARFTCASWEQFYDWMRKHGQTGAKTATMIRYLEQKSAGYRNGKLQAAFPSLVNQ